MILPQLLNTHKFLQNVGAELFTQIVEMWPCMSPLHNELFLKNWCIWLHRCKESKYYWIFQTGKYGTILTHFEKNLISTEKFFCSFFCFFENIYTVYIVHTYYLQFSDCIISFLLTINKFSETVWWYWTQFLRFLLS